MTTYAHDPAASTVVALWPTGDGAVAHRVARVPPSFDPALARRVTASLTALSSRLWLAYSEDEIDGIPFRRLPEAVLRPHQPIGDLVRRAEDDREEAAHQIGRIVCVLENDHTAAAGSPCARGRAFRDAIVRDVAAECEAVRAADRGDLSGRAQQAVEHPRPDASAAQIAVAHALLHDDPFGPIALGTTVEPTAAAVAALRWLQAAAASTAELVGHDQDDVVALAQAIEHEDLRVARFALRMLPGRGAADVVWDLLHEAVLAGRGRLVICPDRYEASDERDEAGHRIITAVLDPREPARSLVGGLIQGIHGCFRVYLDEISSRERPGVDPMLTGQEWAADLRTRFRDGLREAMRSPQ